MMNLSIPSEAQMIKGHAAMLLMALLQENPRHGYELRQALIERSRQVVKLSFGTLYPLLNAMEKRGLVSSKSVPAGKIRRLRQYTLTEKGRAALEQHQLRWKAFATAVDLVLTPPPSKKR